MSCAEPNAPWNCDNHTADGLRGAGGVKLPETSGRPSSTASFWRFAPVMPTVGGRLLVVRGAVVQGVVKLGTVFTR
jgi:hypothetical protein